MIPKTIHAFWFGRQQLPTLAVRSMRTWARHLPDFEIKLWNEDTYDVEAVEFTRQAYAKRRFAFVADYARLDVLQRHGGVYLDVDVEVRKTLSPLLSAGAFLGFMYDCNLGTAVIGARPEHPLITSLLTCYQERVDQSTPNNDLFTQHLLRTFPDFRLNNSLQRFGDVTVYPKEYFEFPIFWGTGGYTVHHFMGSWWRGADMGERAKTVAKLVGGRPGYWLLRQLSHQRAIRRSPFLERYLLDSRRAQHVSNH